MLRCEKTVWLKLLAMLLAFCLTTSACTPTSACAPVPVGNRQVRADKRGGSAGTGVIAKHTRTGRINPYPNPYPPFYTLVENAKPSCVIVTEPDASGIEIYAAKELVEYVRKITGVELKLANRPDENLRPIYLGRTAKKRLRQVEWEKLGADGFVLRSTPEAILIAGNEDLGTLYGTYHFIEKHLGVRWFMPADIGEVVPESKILQVGTFNEVEVPCFGVRWIDSGQWALRQKMNVKVSVGGKPVGINWQWGFHTFFKLIRPEKYFDDHPEWFALINGKRIKPEPNQQGRQLCTSNPEVIEEVAKNIIRIFDEDPSIDIFALSPQDGGGFCECGRCRALDEKRTPEQSWHAKYSNRLAVFNNEVARRVAKKYPDKLIKVGAYAMYLRVPLNPGYKPEPNLAIQVCHTYSCNNHRVALPTCERNRKMFTEELEHWARLTKHLFIYEYYQKYAWGGFPYCQIHVIREDIPYYHNLGVEGFYTQEARGGWPACGLNHYIAAKLAWNVELDVDRLLEDFYEKFYAESAQPMRRYYEHLERAFVEAEVCLSPFGLESATIAALDFFGPEVITALDNAVSEAEQIAKSDIVRRRIQLVRVGVDYTKKFLNYMNVITTPFKGIDLQDAEAVAAAHKKAVASGEPLSVELKKFCKENNIRSRDDIVEAHKWLNLVIRAAAK